MRVMGHNVLAIVLAAIAIYAIEFVIFAVMISAEQYHALIGATADQLYPDRMPLGIVSPVLAAIGISLAIKWRAAAGWMAGATTGLLMALLLAFAGSFYAYVYGSHTLDFVAINLGHFLVCYAVAGAILGAWK
jgi:Protein of unknown function (DUF1761)